MICPVEQDHSDAKGQVYNGRGQTRGADASEDHRHIAGPAQPQTAPLPQKVGAEDAQGHQFTQGSGQARAAHPHAQAKVKDKVDVPHNVDHAAGEGGGGADTGGAVIADQMRQHRPHQKNGRRPGKPLGVLHGIGEQLIVSPEEAEQWFPQEQIHQHQGEG